MHGAIYVLQLATWHVASHDDACPGAGDVQAGAVTRHSADAGRYVLPLPQVPKVDGDCHCQPLVFSWQRNINMVCIPV